MIYLIAAKELGLCKIGYSADPSARLASLQTGAPFDLEIVLTRDGGHILERCIQQECAAYAKRGEWFYYEKEIEDIFRTTQISDMISLENLLPESAPNSTHEQLKRDIEAFCKSHEMSGARFGELSVGNPAFWFKFSRGSQPTIGTYDRLRDFMASYKSGPNAS